MIIGAGAANLIAAAEIAAAGIPVHIYEQNKAAGRKFLVAGHGGFNLTHSEDIVSFVSRYDKLEMREIVRAFDNKELIRWLAKIGVPTYTGSSGKIFPEKGIKPIQVLQAILAYLKSHDVQIFYGHKMVDFDSEFVELVNGNSRVKIRYQNLVLGLGGGSWRKTGSDAAWVTLLESKGIKVNSLQAANSGLNVERSFSVLSGKVLKNIYLRFGDNKKAGEILFTDYGIEGAPVYYMNRFIRSIPFPLILHIDLKPTLTQDDIRKRLESSNAKIADILRDKIKLSPVAADLAKILAKEVYTNPSRLADALKSFPIQVTGFRGIDEVISTAGGICFSELDSSLRLYKFPSVFCVGEMLDWEAPTGGYLLQACFSSGYWAASKIKEAVLREIP